MDVFIACTLSIIIFQLLANSHLFFLNTEFLPSQFKNLNNEFIENYLKEKFKVDNFTLKLIHSEKMFAAQFHNLFKRQFILFFSSEVLKQLDSNELKYVINHEFAHYKFKHSLFEFFVNIDFTILIVLTALVTQNIFVVILVGIIFGLIVIRFKRFMEYQADCYALQNLEGKIAYKTATEKFIQSIGKKTTPFWKRILLSSMPYEERFKIYDKHK